jgi:hypothetical protein
LRRVIVSLAVLLVLCSGCSRRRTMYVCHRDRCGSSPEFGRILEPGVRTYNIPSSVNGVVVQVLRHGDEVDVVGQDGPDDSEYLSWYRLKDGTWIPAPYLTEELCTAENLERSDDPMFCGPATPYWTND